MMQLRGVGYRVFSVVRWIERSSFGAKTGRVLALGGEEEACKLPRELLETIGQPLQANFMRYELLDCSPPLPTARKKAQRPVAAR